MRPIFGILLIFFSQLTFSQLITKPIYSQKKQQLVTQVAPASLPFWDDFSISETNVDAIRVWGSDSSLQWDYSQSKDVFVNSTLAINPPTYRVVTFDGLDANGGFHTGNEFSLADQLQSDTIDLSSYQKSDSIYISFYWQMGGNVEKPDEGDSLRLQFYNPDADLSPWKTVWFMEGNDQKQKADSVFIQAIELVKEEFLTEKFIFRFQSFGDLDGPFDAWHLDWIYLNAGRSRNEVNTGYKDRAFSGQLKNPFSPFTSVPLNQIRNNLDKYIDKQSILISNLDGENPQPISYQHEIIDTESKTSLFLNQIEEVNPLLLASTIQEVLLDSIVLSGLPISDSIVLQSSIFILDAEDSLLASPIDLKINDTIRQGYLFHDYYAYDDGTAEYAAGTNVQNGQIAVKFWLEEQDTLTHVAFHFPNITPSASGKNLTLKILDSLDENKLPLRTQQITIQPDSTINGFTIYELSRPLVLSDTFFIAYQQNANEYIGVGFDRSNMEASDFIFENTGEGWIKNIRIKGALMIRPIFKNVEEFTLGDRAVNNLRIFPNPTRGIFYINGVYDRVEVIDISGKVLFREKSKSYHNISNLEGGLYLLRVHQKDGVQTFKIIKNE